MPGPVYMLDVVIVKFNKRWYNSDFNGECIMSDQLCINIHVMHLWSKHLHGVWLHEAKLCFPPFNDLRDAIHTYDHSFINNNISLPITDA